MNIKIAAQEILLIAKSILAKKDRLESPVRKIINNELYKITTGRGNNNTYYDKIPLDTVFSALKRHGVIPVMEDGRQWSGFLTGRSGHTNIPLVRDLGKPSYSPNEEFENTVLHLNWEKMGSGRYEFLCYLS